MESRCSVTRPDVVILSDDFAGMEWKSCFWVTRSGQETEFFATLDGLSAAGGTKLVEGACTVCLDGVLGDEELRGDLSIAEAAGDQAEDFQLASGDAEGLLLGCVGREGLEGGGFRRDEHFPHHNRFATARDAEAEPDAEGCEEDGDESAVELDGVLDDDEAVFGVLEGGDEKAADETEDESVAPHDGVAKKYNGDGEEWFHRPETDEPRRDAWSLG
jgi:hypothetical protein